MTSFFGLLARWNVHGDCCGDSTWLHTALYHRNSGCNSTASCEDTRLLCGNRLLHPFGNGRAWPRRQPRQRLVSLSCWCLHLCCRTGCRNWHIDTALRTHFVVVDDIHCRLSTHWSQFPRYNITTVSASLSHHVCVQFHAQLVGFLSITTSSRRTSVHWFLIKFRVVLILHFQHLRAFSCVHHRCTLCSPSNNCFLRVGCTSDVF